MKKQRNEASKMAQQIMSFSTKVDDLDSVSETHMWKERTASCKSRAVVHIPSTPK